MNKECEVVRDLLPLYAENMVSTGSRELVQAHLKECENCRAVLTQTEQTLPLPAETEVTVFSQLKKGLRKRTVFPVLLTVFLALTVFAGILVCGLVPVWMTAEEAIVSVEQLEDGSIRVKAADEVYGVNGYNNSICFETLRLDWFVNATVKQRRQESQGYFYYQLAEGESLWYSGEQTGTEDALLWGNGERPSKTFMQARGDRTLVYVFWVSLMAGALLLLAGCVFKNNRFGKLLMYAALLSLCCAASSLFVTDGHLLTKNIVGASVRFNRLSQQMIAIAVMTLMSYLSVLFGWLTVKAYRN